VLTGTLDAGLVPSRREIVSEELDGAVDDLLRTHTVVQDVEAVTRVWMVQHIESGACPSPKPDLLRIVDVREAGSDRMRENLGGNTVSALPSMRGPVKRTRWHRFRAFLERHVELWVANSSASCKQA
jgi:hypothetical protein